MGWIVHIQRILALGNKWCKDNYAHGLSKPGGFWHLGISGARTTRYCVLPESAAILALGNKWCKDNNGLAISYCLHSGRE